MMQVGLPAMRPETQLLPMTPAGCGLDAGELTAQLARYRHLSASVLGVDRYDATARIAFAERVDSQLIEQTLAIERSCCSFFTLDYDSSQRLLTITADAAHRDALSALLSALAPPPKSRPV